VLLLALCDVRTGSDLKLRTKLFGELVVLWVSAGRFKPLPPCNIIAQKMLINSHNSLGSRTGLFSGLFMEAQASRPGFS